MMTNKTSETIETDTQLVTIAVYGWVGENHKFEQVKENKVVDDSNHFLH